MNVVLVDGANLLIRNLYGSGKRDEPGSTPRALTNFLNMLSKYARVTYPSRLIFCWDNGASEFRKRLLPEYKANRISKDATIVDPDDIFEKAKEILDALGIEQIDIPNVEADDIIAGYVAMYKQTDFIYIISADKDFSQLIDEEVIIYHPGETAPWTLERWNETNPYTPEEFVFVLALTGDKVDNIPGVGGIGIKRAATLIKECDGSFSQILRDAPLKYPGFKSDIFVRNIALVDLRSGYVEMELPPIPWFNPVEGPKDERWDYAKKILDKYHLRMIKHALIQGDFWE